MHRVLLLTPLLVCSCMMSTRGHGPAWVGQDAVALVKVQGMPDRQSPAPSGATVYSYGRRNLHGDELCTEDYFVAAGRVIGFNEHGVAIGCGAKAGQIS